MKKDTRNGGKKPRKNSKNRTRKVKWKKRVSKKKREERNKERREGKKGGGSMIVKESLAPLHHFFPINRLPHFFLLIHQ